MDTKKKELIRKLLKIIDEKFEKQELDNMIIEQEQLKQRNIIIKFRELIPELKQHYNSEMLNCLHKNSLSKQKFPAVNMLRQILKCNNYKLKPFIVCNGYDKTNGKKLVERKYVIKSMSE